MVLVKIFNWWSVYRSSALNSRFQKSLHILRQLFQTLKVAGLFYGIHFRAVFFCAVEVLLLSLHFYPNHYLCSITSWLTVIEPPPSVAVCCWRYHNASKLSLDSWRRQFHSIENLASSTLRGTGCTVELVWEASVVPGWSAEVQQLLLLWSSDLLFLDSLLLVCLWQGMIVHKVQVSCWNSKRFFGLASFSACSRFLRLCDDF